MKLFSSIKSRMKSYHKDVTDAGFNMLEIVIGVGIILILSVGGILTYQGITANAKTSAVESAASSVFTAAVAYDLDGDNDTVPADAATEYNASQNGDKEITATVTGSGDTLSVSVTNNETPAVTATRAVVNAP